MKPTLATIHQFTAQEIFDYVVNHLVTQRIPSVNEDGKCRYRGPGGRMCAAGCLISDEEYERGAEKLEGANWHTLVHKGLAPGNHQDLIWSLQKAHDYAAEGGNHYPHELKSELTGVAEAYGLKWPVFS